MSISPEARESPQREAWRDRLSARLDLALSVLALVMLVLLIIELGDLGPDEWRPRVIQASTAIWAIFVVAFILELALAPSKREYLKRNWLVALSLAIPFLRVFRVARAVRILRGGRALRGVTLGRTAGALNRARKVLVRFAAVSQFVYVIALAVAVTVTTAAVVFALERGAPGTGVTSFGEALWWSVNVVTAGGGETETVTLEGRLAAVFLRVFGVGTVGYLTARIAVFFLGEHAREERDQVNLERDEMHALRAEIQALRNDLRTERMRRDRSPTPPSRVEQPPRR